MPSQLLVRFQDRTHVLTIDSILFEDALVSSSTSSINHRQTVLKEHIQQFLSNTTGWPRHLLTISHWNLPFVSCRIVSSIRGGKGGFGTLLKGQSRQAGANATTNFGACRDLQGRRLRHVNQAVEAKIYQEWKEKLQAGTATEVEMAHALLKTNTGVAGWHLQLPAWADVSGSKERRKWQGKFHRWKREMEAAEREKSERKRKQEEHVQSYLQQAEDASAHVKSTVQTALQEGLLRAATKKPKINVTEEPPAALLTLAGDVVMEAGVSSTGRAPKWQLQSQSNFCTVAILLDAATTTTADNNSWYYEMVVITGGLVQVGWATKAFRPCSETGDGVGDCLHSWGYDGSRQIRLHESKEESYGDQSWKAGDVIGCLCQNGKLSFTLNGVDMGVAFATKTTAASMFPVISCNPGEIVELHLHTHEFQHSPASTTFTAVGEALAGEDAASLLVQVVVEEQQDNGDADTEKKQPAQERQQTEPPTDEKSKPAKAELVIEALDLEKYESVQELEALGLDRLKGALMAIQVKCGGTLQERATRLWSLKGLKPEDFPAKLRAKQKK